VSLRKVGLAMMRGIVLVSCLAAAGGIALYTHYSRGDSGEPVYTVPSRPMEPPRPSPPGAAAKANDPADRAAQARELQRELRRVGCYSGEVNGVWTTSSRMAMKTFVERVNAALPIDNPDPVLLSLVQGHRDRACGVCPPGQTATAAGACVPGAVLTTAAPADARPDADKPDGAATEAGAAAAPATPSAAPKPGPRAADPMTPARTAPAAAAPGPPGGPVPPEGLVRERRPRHSAEAPPRPPKVVRDVLKVLGF
jgi:hypothetical protein